MSKPPADRLTMDGELLTLAELAARLKCSQRSIRRRVALGELPARQFGNQLRFFWSEVVASLPRATAAAAVRPAEPGVVTLDVLTRLKLKSQHFYRNTPSQPGGAA